MVALIRHAARDGGTRKRRATEAAAGPGQDRQQPGSREEGTFIMLAAMRQAKILEQVKQAGGVRVSDLSQLLGVSDMTIRRDLDALARQGLIAKVHGGATTIEYGSADEPGFAAKSIRELQEKSAIAEQAAALIQPGSAVALTAGTTTWTLARHLRNVQIQRSGCGHAPDGGRSVLVPG